MINNKMVASVEHLLTLLYGLGLDTSKDYYTEGDFHRMYDLVKRLGGESSEP